jgi:hypothetical protein
MKEACNGMLYPRKAAKTKTNSKCRSSPPSSRDLDDDISLTDDASDLAPVIVDILAKEKDLKAVQQRVRAVLDKHIAERGSNTEPSSQQNH